MTNKLSGEMPNEMLSLYTIVGYQLFLLIVDTVQHEILHDSLIASICRERLRNINNHHNGCGKGSIFNWKLSAFDNACEMIITSD